MSNLDKLAKMFNERENKPIITATIGTVISIDPIRIKYGDNIILEQRRLVIASHVLNGYTRTFQLTNVQMTQIEGSSGEISFHLKNNPPSQDYTITGIDLPSTQASSITATMTYTDTLKVNDKVILIPDNNLKKWHVIDRAVTL